MRIENIEKLTNFLNNNLQQRLIENISGGKDEIDDDDAKEYFRLSLKDYSANNGTLELPSFQTKSRHPETIWYDEIYNEDDSVDYIF